MLLGKGNLAFSSYDCLNGKRTSRRDDIISLLYIMLHLYCGDFRFLVIDLEFIKDEEMADKEMVEAKKNSTAETLCEEDLEVFKDFAK